MIQGTASYVGKTIIVAAICRILSQAGVKVAPFKAQNMSLNSYVTKGGREIARAQAFQAFAAGIEPRVEMNPILLKPKGGTVSQVVLMGKPYRDISAKEYYADFTRNQGLRAVRKSLKSLLREFDAVVIEGAGSPAEINLYSQDIANMKVAGLTNAPVFLVADIERGGVFASAVGTICLLPPEDRKRVKGIIINKFHGDPTILESGLSKLEERTGKPVLGVVPYIENLDLPWEDSMSLDDLRSYERRDNINVAVIRLPFMSNSTDIHPLIAAGLRVNLVKSVSEIGNPDVLIIPGTKNTMHDLRWLRKERLDDQILRLRRSGVPIIGICGGYQILGKEIVDTLGLEDGVEKIEMPTEAKIDGLGLLDITTKFNRYKKKTRRVRAKVIGAGPILGSVLGKLISAYEIHMGETRLVGTDKSSFKILKANRKGLHVVPHYDGAISNDGLVIGSYLHGLFDDGTIIGALLGYLAQRKGIKRADTGIFNKTGIESTWEESLNLLCATLRSNVDIDRILNMAGITALSAGVSS